MSREAVRVNDVGPRDGLQNQAQILTPAQRLQLIEALVAAGLKSIEFGAFVSPKAVPAMAGTDELAALLADYAAFTGEDSGLTVEVPLVDMTDPAVVVDAATTTDPVDPSVVVDPKASGDTGVFTGETAPVDPDADPATDPAVIATDEPAPTDVAVDLPSLDGLFQMDSDGFDLDLTVLEVGRALGQFGFTDLP